MYDIVKPAKEVTIGLSEITETLLIDPATGWKTPVVIEAIGL